MSCAVRPASLLSSPMPATPSDILGMAFFARVVEAKSFSLAARTLGVSKSAVSARVARLEERLGVRLLHRTTRRLALTADGVRLYELCARVVSHADEAADVAAGASSLARGTLRVRATTGFAQRHLLGPIREFQRLHPGLGVDLRLSDRAAERTVEDVDVALLLAGRLADSSLTARKLATVRVSVVASPDYLRRRGIPFRPQDLVDHDCMAHSVRVGKDELAFATDEGTVEMGLLAKLVANDGAFLREAAIAGLGVVMLPELLVDDALRERRLFRILEGFHASEISLIAVHAHGQLPPASVRAFVDHLARAFRKPSWEERVTAERRVPPARPPLAIPMTEQDVRRLTAVADLYEAISPDAVTQLRAAVARASRAPASKIPRNAVTMNSRIRLRDGREVSLVYPWDETKRDRTSVLGPLGLELLGARIGKRIEAIPYQPEAAGDHHL